MKDPSHLRRMKQGSMKNQPSQIFNSSSDTQKKQNRGGVGGRTNAGCQVVVTPWEPTRAPPPNSYIVTKGFGLREREVTVGSGKAF